MEQKTSNHVPNPDRGCIFIDTGIPGYVRPSWSNPPGMQPHECGRMCFLAVVSINMLPLTGLHVYRYGHPGLRPAELVKPTGNAASRMRPDVLSGRSVYKHATPSGVACL